LLRCTGKAVDNVLAVKHRLHF
jgi:CheY-like chemotaxis protein